MVGCVVRHSSEPIWWSLFAAGGVVAALVAPVQIALTGIAAALGWADDAFTYARVLALVSHPISRLYLFVLISLPLFHSAHRFRFTLIDLGLKQGRGLVAVLCYGAAVAGTILAALVLIRL
ncbi:MAG: fumarate reductase subunit D [Armatimonadetes bacterium]|nr:fumarate reductase subunit D [Armatimonadota bacterium]